MKTGRRASVHRQLGARASVRRTLRKTDPRSQPQTGEPEPVSTAVASREDDAADVDDLRTLHTRTPLGHDYAQSSRLMLRCWVRRAPS